MASEASIVNIALRAIGGSPITALDDGSTNANYAVDIFDDLRDELLAAGEWKFASRRVQLSRLAATPAYQFDYAFALPADWLRTIEVHDNSAGYGTLEYREEDQAGQGVILASREQLWVRYVYRCTDVNRWSAGFRRAMSMALARDLALPVADSNRMHEVFVMKAERALGRAKSRDSMGSSPQRRPQGSWVTARGGRYPRIIAR